MHQAGNECVQNFVLKMWRGGGERERERPSGRSRRENNIEKDVK
jgi:hypothetical protein